MAIMDPNRLKSAVEEHEQLMAALRTQNADAARQIWRKHLLNTGQSVTDVLRSQALATVSLTRWKASIFDGFYTGR